MGYNRYAAQVFHFDYDLDRGEETLSLEVTYSYDGGEVTLDSVRCGGREMETTLAEDLILLSYAQDCLTEDLINAEADYGDYLYDMRRDQED